MNDFFSIYKSNLSFWCSHDIFTCPRNIMYPNRNKGSIDEPPLWCFKLRWSASITTQFWPVTIYRGCLRNDGFTFRSVRFSYGISILFISRCWYKSDLAIVSSQTKYAQKRLDNVRTIRSISQVPFIWYILYIHSSCMLLVLLFWFISNWGIR